MRNKFKKLISYDIFGILLFLIVICLVTGIINPNFLSVTNLFNILRLISFVGFIAVGMTFVIIGGGIDLSIGSIIGLSGVTVALCLQNGVPVVLSILIGLSVGVVVGTLNGFLINKIGIPPFIATLGMLYIVKGIDFIISKARPIYPLPKAFTNIGKLELFGASYTIYIMIFVVGVSYFILNHTAYGRYITAIGGNEVAAKAAGIKVRNVRLTSYIIVGFLASITGILITARVSSGFPGSGDGWELKAIAAAIIGGASVTGGAGSILGALIGAAIISVLENAMVLLKISVYWQNLVVGLIIILAVTFDQYKRKLKAKML